MHQDASLNCLRYWGTYELFILKTSSSVDYFVESRYTFIKSINIKEAYQSDWDFFLAIQERYIIGHELGHWLFRLSENEKLDGNISVPIPEMMNEIQLMLAEIYAAYEQLFQSQDYVELIHEQKSILAENSTIHEECFADAIAYAITFSHVQSRYPGDPKKMLMAGQALFLEMMHLQLLAMQHMTTSDESFESSISIRLGFLRNYAYLYFEDNKDMFDRMLEASVIRYEEQITNPMLECFAELERRADQIYDTLTGEDGLTTTMQLL